MREGLTLRVTFIVLGLMPWVSFTYIFSLKLKKGALMES